MIAKPIVTVHKFSSCDGCQLAFLNLGSDLLLLTDLVDIVHFAEAGPLDEDRHANIAFVEGSISTKKDVERIQKVRKNSDYLITIGACATSGGIQALKNISKGNKWVEAIYASPEYIDLLDEVSPIAEYIKVDFEIWGCPVSSEQVVAVVRSLLSGVKPMESSEKVCMECKRSQTVCRMVTRGESCLGPVTRAGCGAICPKFGRACYACYGPAVDSNTSSLANRFSGLGLMADDISRQFQLFNNNAPVFRNIAKKVVSENSEQ